MIRSVHWMTAVIWSTCWIAALAAPMATEVDVKVSDPQLPGCLYNGQLYNEGATVPTKESCLNCSCRQGALRCHLQVCPYAHDLYPPPVGCILVERKGACCPKLHCPDKAGESGLARKDPSGQISSWKLRDDMRRRLVKQINRHASDKQGCVEGGTAYADGSGMMSSSTCEYCFCLKGKQTCVKPRCHTPLGKEGCVPRYRPMVCCPVQYDCDVGRAKNGTDVHDQRDRPLIGNQATSIRGNDRVIDSPTIPEKQTVRRRRSPDAGADEATQDSTEVTPQAETDQLEAETTTDAPAATASGPVSDQVKEQVVDNKPVDEVSTTSMAPKSEQMSAEAAKEADPPAPKPENVEDPEPKPEKVEEPAPKPEKAEDPEPNPEKVEDSETKPEKVEDSETKSEKVEDSETKSEKVEDSETKPEKVEDSETKPEKVEDTETKSEKVEEPVPKPEKVEDPEPKPEKAEEPEKSIDPVTKVEEIAEAIPEKIAELATKPEESADPVTHNEPAAKPEIFEFKPDEAADPVRKPEESADPASKPEGTPKPASNAEESADAVVEPEESAEAARKPEESADATVQTAEDRVETGDPEDEIDAEGAERAIQVSVSSSVSSVTGEKVADASKETSRTTQDVSQEKRISSVSVNVSVQEAPSNATSDNVEDAADAAESEEPKESASEEPKAEDPAPSSPAPPAHNFAASQPSEESESVEEQDYDYQHMELPPSLPNLEIIPFVAADAVVGHPNDDLDDDERLNLGGVADQRTPVSQQSPSGDQSTTEFCLVDGGFFSHGELISKSDPCQLCRCNLGRVVCTETRCAPLPDGCHRKERPGSCCGQVVCGVDADNADSAESRDEVQPSDKTQEGTTSTTLSPLLAFRVTFPPRPSSTLPSSPSPTFIRFPTRRLTTTQRPTPPTTHRTKFNKPAAANNLFSPSFATGGLKVDSCNIYGQVYRVGRIIEELSGPCVECKCTEIGVNCFPLKC